LCILEGVVRTLIIHKAAMKEHLRTGFTTMTELADTLVREKGYTFRKAHRIVGAVALAMARDGKAGSNIRPEDLDAAGERIFGEPVEISRSTLDRAIDPEAGIGAHDSQGSCYPEETVRMISASRRRLVTMRALTKRRRDLLSSAWEQTDKLVERILGPRASK